MRLWTKALCSGSVQRIIPTIWNDYIAYKIDSPKYLYINKFNIKKYNVRNGERTSYDSTNTKTIMTHFIGKHLTQKKPIEITFPWLFVSLHIVFLHLMLANNVQWLRWLLLHIWCVFQIKREQKNVVLFNNY